MNTSETTPAVTPARPEGYRALQAFAAQPDVVFAALTSAEAISRWWAPCTGTGAAADAAAADGSLARRHRGGGGAPARHVRWLVAMSEPLPGWAGTDIDFELRAAAEGGTALDFCHEGLTEQFECYDVCAAGWRQYLPAWSTTLTATAAPRSAPRTTSGPPLEESRSRG